MAVFAIFFVVESCGQTGARFWALLFYILLRMKTDWPLLLLTLAAACQSLCRLREFDMFFNLNTPLDIPPATVFPQLFLLLPLAYLVTRMGRWRKWCAWSVGLGGAAALL